MSNHPLPAAFVSRLHAWLRGCDQPLIQLWGWPWSGKRRLLDALIVEEPAAWLGLEPGDFDDRVARSHARWLVAEGSVGLDEILRSAEGMRPEQRLILPVDRRLRDEILPLRSLCPCDLLLHSEEVEEMFPGLDSSQVEELLRVTDGWLGPLDWLGDRWSPGESLEPPMRSAAFASAFHQHVIRRLDREVFATITECSVVDDVDAAVWRRVWKTRPTKLAALEQIVSDWGWLIPRSDGGKRLPRLLRRAVRRELQSSQRNNEAVLKLGLAAHGLGIEESAERYLMQAGDAPRLARLRSLGVGGPKGFDQGAVKRPSSRRKPSASEPDRGHPPRFSLKLLGQPLVQRIDSGGGTQELVWSLQRALQSVAFLALAPDHRATKDELIDAVWYEVLEDSIHKNFHPTLSDARRTLGLRNVFLYRQGLYSLNPEIEWRIDCELFRQQIEKGRLLLRQPGNEPAALEAWLAAWALYHGPLLVDIDAVWLQPLRESFYLDYTELLRNIGELSARLEHRTQALDAYRSLLLEEPFEERIHLAVMELYARQGRRDLVRRQFVRMQELLLEELNVEPLDATLERYHQLMR